MAISKSFKTTPDAIVAMVGYVWNGSAWVAQTGTSAGTATRPYISQGFRTLPDGMLIGASFVTQSSTIVPEGQT